MRAKDASEVAIPRTPINRHRPLSWPVSVVDNEDAADVASCPRMSAAHVVDDFEELCGDEPRCHGCRHPHSGWWTASNGPPVRRYDMLFDVSEDFISHCIRDFGGSARGKAL